MKKTLLLATSLLLSLSASAAIVTPTGPDGESLPPYDDGFDASKNNVYCTSLTITATDQLGDALVLDVNQQTDNRKYFNFTDRVFRAYQGSTVSIAWTGHDAGRHNSRAVFVDWNQNYQFDGDPNVEARDYSAFVNFVNTPTLHAEIKPDVELVAFEVCGPNKCTPTGTRGDYHGSFANPMTFVIPEHTRPGKYLVRQTNAWNNLNPENPDNGNGISVIDFYIEVYSHYYSDILNPQVAKDGDNRYTGNIIVSYTNTDGQPETLTIGELQNKSATDKAYYDRSDMVFTAAPGTTFSLTNNVGEGTGGMQKYLFIDWNNDYKFGPAASNADYSLSNYIVTESTATSDNPLGKILTPELAFYHAVKYASAGTWYNTSGITTNQSIGYNFAINNITIPEGTPDGDYRIRYKYSWNDLNPYIASNGAGIVVDFTLRVLSTIDCTLNFDGVTSTITCKPGETISIEDISQYIPPFFVPSVSTITIPTDSNTINVAGEWQFPFELNKPYFLTLRKATDGYSHIYYDGTNLKNKDINSNHLTLNPYLIWYMTDGGIVNNTKTVTLHSLSTAATSGIQVGSEDNSLCTITDNANDITKFVVHTNGNSFGLHIAGIEHACLNDYKGNGTVAVWNHNIANSDEGGRIWVTELTDNDFNVKSWVAHDGFTYTLDETKLASARSAKTIEALRDLFAYVPKTKINHADVISSILDNSDYHAILNIMVSSGLFDNETASGLIFNALNIPDESNDFNAVLTDAEARLTSMSASELVSKFLNGKKIMFKCNGWYIKKGLSKGDSALTPDAVWEFVADTDNRFTLRNAVDGKYACGLNVTENADNATHYLLANETKKNDGSFAIQNPDQTGNNYLNNNTTNDRLRYFAAEAGNGQSFWTIHLVTNAMEQTWINNAISAITGPENATYGNEPGMYTPIDSEDINETLTALREMTPANIDYALIDRGIHVSTQIFDLNSIQGPALIQMAYTPNSNVTNYADFFSGQNQVTDTNSSDGTVGFGHSASTFVLHNGKLHSYESGLGIVYNSDGPAIFAGSNWSENAEAMNVDFVHVDKSVLVRVPDGTYRHTYALKQSGTDNTFGATSTHHKITWGHISGTPAENYAYSVWYVKQLSIDVDPGSARLWRTPVAVSFAELSSYAYEVSVIGSQITTTQVAPQETIYGAGTIFLLTGNVVVDVHNGVDIEANTAGIGHHSKRLHTLHARKVYIYVHTDDSQTANRVAALKVPSLYSNSTPSYLKMDVIIPETDTEKLLEPNEALIEADNNPEKPMKDGESFDLSMGDTTTVGISEVTSAESGENTVYDLMGRRLAAPTKGFNIVNGKKIIVK